MTVLAAFALASCSTSHTHTARSTTAKPSPSSSPSCDATCQAIRSVEATQAAAPTSSAYLVPTAADFTISLKILTRQCFGSAGCVISYRPELTQHVPYGSFDPSVTYDVTYVVSGDQSGPQTDTLYVTGDNYQQPDQGEAETAGSGVRLTVKITDVSAE